MTRNRILIIAIMLLLAGGFAGWYYGSPLWTLSRMQRAADAHDGAALASYVDFPAFRASLASELTDELADQAGGADTGLGALAKTLGGRLVERAADTLVTPGALRRAFATGIAAEDDPEPLRMKLGKAPKIERTGLSEFRVIPRNRRGTLIFHREGLGWKLVGIDLPPADDGPGEAAAI